MTFCKNLAIALTLYAIMLSDSKNYRHEISSSFSSYFSPLLKRLESFVNPHNLKLSEGGIAAHRVADLYEISYYVEDAEGILLVEKMRQLEKYLAQLKSDI